MDLGTEQWVNEALKCATEMASTDLDDAFRKVMSEHLAVQARAAKSDHRNFIAVCLAEAAVRVEDREWEKALEALARVHGRGVEGSRG